MQVIPQMYKKRDFPQAPKEVSISNEKLRRT